MLAHKYSQHVETFQHEVYICVGIDGSALLSWQLLEAVIGNLHILVPINLEDVAALLVDGEPSHHVAPVKVPAAYDLQAAECEVGWSLPSNKSISRGGLRRLCVTC